jgi:Mn2+/Fe2+ NRAMP family transporter
VVGPGIIVMLADTDVGSIITAGQSGVQWGYRLLLLQFVLMPILFVAQELTVRLGLFTGRGHGELIRDTFGKFWAYVSAVGLTVAVSGALLSEFSGVAGIGELYGMSRFVTLPLAAALLLFVGMTGGYRRVERVAILFGLFEFAFFIVAYSAHPTAADVVGGAVDIPLRDTKYLYLVAANIGAVIMPWMIFYQQSAIADKRLTPADLGAARVDTAIGAVVTQLIMAAVLVAAAAFVKTADPDRSLNTIGDLAGALTPLFGSDLGKLLFAVGVLGAGMVAAIVASLALAWGLGEVAGFRRSLELRPAQAPWFYAVYGVCVVGGALLVAVWPDLVSLNIAVQVMNALLLPLVLGFLIALAVRALPEEVRLRGAYLWIVVVVAAITCAFGVFGGINGAVAG